MGIAIFDKTTKSGQCCTMQKLKITHLYPRKMCIYGDLGNIRTLQCRARKLGFHPIIQPIHVGEALPEWTDMYFIGGGQDNDQFDVYQDLLAKKTELQADIEDGAAMLAICGGYQLLGRTFVDGTGRTIDGLDIFPVQTVAPDDAVTSRCIGNLVIGAAIPELEETYLVGFENHGGQTTVLPDHPHVQKGNYLGKVLHGYGNSAAATYEGYVYNNAIGTYLHGPCLPKNPELANWLLQRAVQRIDRHNNTSILQQTDWSAIDDKIALTTKNQLAHRFLGHIPDPPTN